MKNNIIKFFERSIGGWESCRSYTSETGGRSSLMKIKFDVYRSDLKQNLFHVKNRKTDSEYGFLIEGNLIYRTNSVSKIDDIPTFTTCGEDKLKLFTAKDNLVFKESIEFMSEGIRKRQSTVKNLDTGKFQLVGLYLETRI